MKLSLTLIRFAFSTLLMGLAASPVTAWAQVGSPAKLEFDVASLKMLKGPVAPHGVALNFSHGRLTVDAGELRQIIGLAFGIQRVLVRGCPDWCDEDKFDIIAKTDNLETTRDQMRAMLQALLVERFKLTTHRETKTVAGYELVVGKQGPVANTLRQPVKDATGLSERYNFNLDFRPQDAVPVTDGVNRTPQAIDVHGMVFAAVEEQLGLKLRARQTPTEVLVVDHVEHPSEN